MEVREFAERVLFSTDLNEKLRGPCGALTDSDPGRAVIAPDLPGRPEVLVPGRSDNRGQFPGIDHIESDADRARLLHFLANHELIAAELMALVLLRFPEAPAQFRQGILRTLLEEQHHTLWYMKRMESLGIPFGSEPVNAFIWNHIKTMEEPIDFVSRLSLTFEQANLDYSRHYAMRFREVGDGATARIFDRIYRDEIDHVSHGLYWFRLWKNGGRSDWEEWTRRLVFPLSPMRAKGVPFNEEGRRVAGLEPDYIRELKVFSKSRGRTPTILLYNPDAEYEMGASGPWHPPAHLIRMIQDLEILPAFLCHSDDVVLVSEVPSMDHRLALGEAGFDLPQFERMEQDRQSVAAGSELHTRRLGRFRPWSWSPSAKRTYQSLNNPASDDSRSLDDCWNPSIRELFSKVWSVEFLHRYLMENNPAPGREWLMETDLVGRTVSDFQSARECIGGFRSGGHHRLVVKLPYGSAGGNQLRLWEEELSDRHWNWIRNGLARQGKLVIEPWLDRVLDFSIQLEVRGPEETRVIGWTGLRNDHRGQFQAIQVPFRGILGHHPEVARLLYGHCDGSGIPGFYDSLIADLGRALAERGYRGPAGIDAFFYRSATGRLKLKPVVEVNPRFTMGRLAIELGRRVQGGRNLSFQLIGTSQLKESGCRSFHDYDRLMRSQHPLIPDDTPSRQIKSGYVALNDPAVARTVLATLLVGQSPS